MASADLRDELDCSICLTTYKDPVMLRCGHNYCRVCIDGVLDTQDGSGVYSCPECREESQERPALMRDIALRNIVKNFQDTESPGHQEEVTGICCTYCVDSPVPAVKTCLHCEASLCDKHLKVHSKSPEHVLCDPSASLEIKKCAIHKEILKYYCTEDAACICVSCSVVGEHRGHRVEMLHEAYEKKKKKLGNVLQKVTIKREETEERVQILGKRRRKTQEKAANLTKKVTTLFTDIRRRLDDLEKRVLSEISRQEDQVSLSLSALIQKLELKEDELSRRMRHLEELCNMTDPITVLQDPDTGDLCDPEEGGGDEDTGGHDKQPHDVDDLDVAVISDTFQTLCDIITDIRRGIHEEDPADILLDVNSAGNYNQVLSSKKFSSGRHYWDHKGSGNFLMPSIPAAPDQSHLMVAQSIPAPSQPSYAHQARSDYTSDGHASSTGYQGQALNTVSQWPPPTTASLFPLPAQPPQAVQSTPLPLKPGIIKPQPSTPAQQALVFPPPQITNADTPIYYVSFTPIQAARLVADLPDPEEQPMTFYRRMARIRKTFLATWRDLAGLAKIRAGDSYWPIMEKDLQDSRVSEDLSYESGVEFCTQLQSWARDRVVSQATSFHDITQEKGESAEKFQTRLTKVFTDLGFSTLDEVHRQMLVNAFITGLRKSLKNNLIRTYPECRVQPMENVLLVVKGLESNPTGKKPSPLMLAKVCYNCGKPGHIRSNCRALIRLREQQKQQWPRTPPVYLTDPTPMSG